MRRRHYWLNAGCVFSIRIYIYRFLRILFCLIVGYHDSSVLYLNRVFYIGVFPELYSLSIVKTVLVLSRILFHIVILIEFRVDVRSIKVTFH